ncbi:MAG: hypothetical protein IK034_01315, partial [Bacilli bacterium]|nr:hypothetical protein [Bacilli bacterium]
VFGPVGRFFAKVFIAIGRFFKKLFRIKDKAKEKPAKKSIDDFDEENQVSLDGAKQIAESETSPSKKKATSGKKKSQKGSK